MSFIQAVQRTIDSPTLYVMQIGAGDGLLSDPVHALLMKPRTFGVLVEPNPVAFDELKVNYAESKGDIRFCPVAVDVHASDEQPFYHFAADAAMRLGFPPGRTQRVLNQYGSLNAQYVDAQHIPYEDSNLHPMLRKNPNRMLSTLRSIGAWAETSVRVLTLGDLFHEFSCPDVLVMDAGGKDLELIWDLPALPQLVRYRHQTTISPSPERDAEYTESFLRERGYAIYYFNSNEERTDDLERAWSTVAIQENA